MFVLLNENGDDKINYLLSADSSYYAWVRMNPGWDMYLQEPRQGDTLFEQKHILIDKSDFAKYEYLMNEEEFWEFAKKNPQWSSMCKGCSWGPYHEVYLVINNPEGRGYMAFRLASIIVDFD